MKDKSFFFIVIVSLVILGFIYYFSSQNKGLSLSAGAEVNLEGSGAEKEGFEADGVEADGEMAGMQKQLTPYEQKSPYLNSDNVVGANVAQEMSKNPALEQLRQSACFPSDQVQPSELLPNKSEATMWSEANPASGSLMNRNMLQAGNLIGIDTVGQTLRNASHDIRSEPPNPQVKVSPWLQTTILPDLARKPFEIGGCGA